MEIPMSDSSSYQVVDATWLKAIEMMKGAQGLTQESFERILKLVVSRHWKQRTVPDKLGKDQEWQRDYQNMAELAPEVLYHCGLRPYVLGITLNTASRGKSSVLHLSSSGVEEISATGVRKFSSLEDFLAHLEPSPGQSPHTDSSSQEKGTSPGQV